MKNINIYLLFCFFGLGISSLQSQIVSVTTGSGFNVKAGTVFSAEGLNLTPSINFSLTSSLSLSASVSNITTIAHINRSYKFSNTTTAFSGTIKLNYQESELNGLIESNLKLLYHDGAIWASDNGSTNDASANTLTSTLSGKTLNELSIGNTMPPNAPVSEAQTFCAPSTVVNLVASGTDLKWYTTETDGTALVITTALTSGTYYVSQTENGIESARTSVAVTINNSVAGSISGASTVCEGTNSTVLTLNGSVGTIQWQSSDTFAGTYSDIFSETAATYTVANLVATTYYKAVVTSGSCAAATTSAVTLTVNPTSVAGTASSNPTLCINTALTDITHSTTGTTGIGSATNLPAGVTAVFATDIITISGTPTASGTFNYSIPLTGGCGSVNATGTIIVTPNNTTTSVAGSAITQCDTAAFTLAGNEPAVGTGLWTVTNGIATIADTSSPTSGVTVTAGNSATLTWTISNGSCAASTSSVVLTNNAIPTTSDAGSAISQCDTELFTLSGNEPVVGTGLWTVTSGTATIADTSSPNSGVTVIAGTSATLTWTISNGSCIASSDTVMLTNNAIPTTSDAGSAITQCDTETFTLAGNEPAVGTGLWTVTSGTATIADTSSPSSGVTVTAGNSATLTWTITNGSCTASSDTLVLTNIALPTATLGGSNVQTKCIDTAISNITYTTTEATGASFSDLPTGVTGVWEANEVIISGTPSESGTFNYSVLLTGGCATTTVSGTITVTPNNTITLTSAEGTDAQSKCIDSAISNITYSTTEATGATFSGLPTGVTGVWAVNEVTISGTPSISGTYNYIVTLTGGCATTTAFGTITVTTNTWVGTTDTLWNNPNNWSCSSVPNSTSDITIASESPFQPVISSDITIHSLTIQVGMTLTVASGSDLTVTDVITNVDSGTIVVQNNANLIQTNDVANTGEITVKRDSSLLLRLDHSLWSSPVTGSQTLLQFSPNTLTNRFYTYTTSSNSYTATSATSTFTAGKGVAIRASNIHSATTPTAFSGTFTGLPNNGSIPFALATNATNGYNYNLVGNPYPSTIDVNAFLDGNTNVVGTIYFYTHSMTMNAAGLFPQGTNYSSRNRSGHTVSTHIDGDLHPAPSAPNGKIQVGQGFLVRATAPGNITFTNAMRTGNNDNQFLRTAEIEKHRIWLNLKTDTGSDINQMMVGYIEGASQGVDTDFDGLLFGVSGSSLASKLDGANYGIQGRSLPFESNDVVPMAFKSSATGNYMISLTNTDGLFAGIQDIFVRDNLMGIDHNIKVSPYTFSSDAGTFDSRFELVYTQALGIPSTDFTSNSVIVYKNADLFHVNTKGITMKDIQVYDVSGRLIYKQSDIKTTTAVLNGLMQTNEVLFLKITSEDNVTVNVKVIN